MKQIFTLFTAVAVMSSFASNAQSTQNFETGISPLTSNCWIFNGVTEEAAKPTGDGINGRSVASAGASYSSFLTPYYALTSGSSFTVSFDITIDKPLSNQASRTVSIGLQNKAGIITNFATYNYNKTTLKTSDLFTLTAPINPTTSGSYRIIVAISADNGDGNTHIIVDNFAISQSLTYHYGTSACNTAPVATNDMFFGTGSLPVTGNVKGNDYDANAGELATPAIVTAPAATQGTVSLAADGSFTFTPAPGFLGGPITFTYQLTDNGYDPLSSNIATVTLNYPELSALPVQLISFNSSVLNNKVQLNWNVADNETGSYFIIEKSTDGRNYINAGVVFISSKAGNETYNYTDANELSGEAYYRLRIVNKNNSTSTSKTLMARNQVNAKANSLVILQNPVEATLTFNYTATSVSTSSVNIYSIAGAKLLSTKVGFQNGINTTSINLNSKLASGTYILEVVNGTQRSISKLIKK